MFLVMRFFQMSGLGREGVYISWAHDTARKEILFLKPPLMSIKTKEEEKEEEEDYYNHIILHI